MINEATVCAINIRIFSLAINSIYYKMNITGLFILISFFTRNAPKKRRKERRLIHLIPFASLLRQCREKARSFLLGVTPRRRRRRDLVLSKMSREGLEIKVVDPPTSNVSAAQTSAGARGGRQRASFAEFRPFKLWFPWLVPAIVVANIVLFAVSMFINDCPKNSQKCSARFLGRFAFQPMKENPLLGPSSTTWVTLKLSTF